MTLTQPDVGSVGWGDSVNQNFQTLEDWVNALPQGSGVPGNFVNFDGSGNLADSGLAVGAGPNNVVQLDVVGRLPAVDGSQLVGLPVPYIGGVNQNLVWLNSGGFPVDSGVGLGIQAWQVVSLDGHGALNGNGALNGFVLPNSQPGYAVSGSMYFDGATLYLFNGSSWIQLYPT